jgi:tetratricopeptide (TPR) repeat protein
MGFLRLFAASTLAPVALAGIVISSSSLPVQAKPLLEETGTIYPAEATYTFEGQAGQALTLTLESSEFDPVLSLLGPNQTEIAFNDDFGGSLNSKIIITLPTNGTYTVVARSFSGQGGDFNVAVRAATEFEITYAKGEALVQVEDYEGAIAAFTQAIAIDPQQAIAYVGRAQATLGQVYLEQDAVESPADIPPMARESVITDFEQAATLFEADGSPNWADSLREQVELLRNTESTSSS